MTTNFTCYPAHMWGDKGFDWEGLEAAIRFISDRMETFGCHVYAKEKFGQARIDVQYWNGSLIDLISTSRQFRFAVNTKYPKLYEFMDFKAADFLEKIKIVSFVRFFLRRRLQSSYRMAIKKWPRLKLEILAGADQYEDLRDVFIEHGLSSPWLPYPCQEGNHHFLADGACKECFIKRG